MRALLLENIPFFVLGLSLAAIGVPLAGWQWWVVVAPMVLTTVVVRSLKP